MANKTMYVNVVISPNEKKYVLALAAKKGLNVREVDNGTWCIMMPNGVVYTAQSAADMVNYIRRY